ncbi:MAG: FAD-dependent monooxygenase [Deltaproteobacteria bacterium]|nr:FAD-dependent monooxygenase [Deltaproteobacteria bacterium]
MRANPDQRLLIAGAGLVGPLLAILLARKGWKVELFDRRQDPRLTRATEGRSVNLALAERGIHALMHSGLMDTIRKLIIPVRGRMIHRPGLPESFQPYSQKESEHIWSISRADLNRELIRAAEATKGVRFHFRHSCLSADPGKHLLRVKDEVSGQISEQPYDALFVADGSSSHVRDSLTAEYGNFVRTEPLQHSYRELRMPSLRDGSGFAMRGDSLHIWPGDDFMMIGLPNPDHSFTMTLFLPDHGKVSFASLKQNAELSHLFQTWFPGVQDDIPDYQEQFFTNPPGQLGTVYCQRWAFPDIVLTGDAAHAMVPFHGQGMNCGFEDCAVMSELMDQGDNFSDIFQNFEKRRREDCHAIATMALENYVEMRSLVKDTQYLLRKEISFILEQNFPRYFIPRYSMVMFHRIPYQEAFQRGQKQEEILDLCCRGIHSATELDLERAEQLLRQLPAINPASVAV